MSIIKWNTNNLFPNLDEFWGDFLNRDYYSKGFDLGTKIPAVNTSETEKGYQLEVAIPGFKKEDLTIHLDNNILTISSEHKEEHEEKEGKKITRKEFNYTSFQRSFELPEHVNKEEINASYVDGILKLHLPKVAITKVDNKKQISIN